MPRSQGFARGDIDTAFPLDDKFLALRGRLSSERYYTAVGVYFTVVAATWREAERKTAAKVAPDAAVPIEDLQSAGLLDADGRVTNRAFTSWIGRARRLRKASTERQARNRAEKSRGVTPMSRVTTSDTVGKARLGTEGTDGTVGTGESEGDDALSTYWTLMGTYPNGRTKTWVEELVNEFDDERVSAALAVESKGDRQGILGRTRDRLRSDADKAAKGRDAAEAAQLQADADARRITPEMAAENKRRVREELEKMIGPVEVA